MIRIKFLFALCIVCFIGGQSIAQKPKVKEPQSGNTQWSQAYPPFRIVGNLYYVGTYDLACYLVVTPKGNILINTGLASSASMIKDNITALGFQYADTKILLTTQGHYDHVAAMAAIQKQTGAQLMADEQDAATLEDGGVSDYEMGKYGLTFEPMKVDRRLKDKDVITLGNTTIQMLHHPGHTRGSCSFLLDVTDETKTYKVLIANLPSIITDRKFSDIPAYPGIAKDFAYTLEAMKNLSFDIWVASHASQFGLHSKHKPGDPYHPEVFIDRKGYDKAVGDLEAAYLKKMKE